MLKNNLTQNEKLGAVYESKRDFKTHGTSFIVIGPKLIDLMQFQNY